MNVNEQIEAKKKILNDLQRKRQEREYIQNTPILESALNIAIYTDNFNSERENESIKHEILDAFRYQIPPKITFLTFLKNIKNGKYDMLIIDYGGYDSHGLEHMTEDCSRELHEIIDMFPSMFILFATTFTNDAYLHCMSTEIKDYNLNEFDLNRIAIMSHYDLKWKEKIVRWF